ncbi:putative RNA-binding protein C17H9.04c [Fusarium oxysporum f. sp. albedinis]|nr:putative RNA-binding protein C17H9.04c [Fusarium oxysporum f. sp. albedinis]
MMIDYLLLLTIEYISKARLLLPCSQHKPTICAFICVASVISEDALSSIPEFKQSPSVICLPCQARTNKHEDQTKNTHQTERQRGFLEKYKYPPDSPTSGYPSFSLTTTPHTHSTLIYSQLLYTLQHIHKT